MFNQVLNLILGTLGMVACGAAIFWLVSYTFKKDEGDNND